MIVRADTAWVEDPFFLNLASAFASNPVVAPLLTPLLL